MTSELKKKALLSLQGKWGLGAGSTFLYYVVSGAILSILSWVLITPFAIQTANTGEGFGVLTAMYVVYAILSMFVTGVLIFGLLTIYIGMARQESVSVSALFSYFRGGGKMWQSFKAVFLVGLYTCLWSLLLVIPGIIKSFSYALTYFILIENPHYTVRQAIAESQQLMKGRKMDLFLLLLSFIGWFILCAITFGLAYFWITPYVTTAMAHFYLGAKGSETDPTALG